MSRVVVRGVVLVMALVLVLATVTHAAPSVQGNASGRGLAAFRRSLFGAGPAERRTINQCTNNAKQQYVCEMCAKETKSLQVYTLCCDGMENAQMWCQSFLLYGINSV